MFKAVYPISNEDLSALPVRTIASAAAYYVNVLGFTILASDTTTAVLTQDDVRIGLICKPDHDPMTAGSCYFDVSNVDDLHGELVTKGAKPGPIAIQHHEGKHYRVFFVREIDSMEIHDGYCFCFGQPAS